MCTAVIYTGYISVHLRAMIYVTYKYLTQCAAVRIQHSAIRVPPQRCPALNDAKGLFSCNDANHGCVPGWVLFPPKILPRVLKGSSLMPHESKGALALMVVVGCAVDFGVFSVVVTVRRGTRKQYRWYVRGWWESYFSISWRSHNTTSTKVDGSQG